MSLVRTIAISALLLTGVALVPQEASAWGSFGFYTGFSRYHPGYYHHYRPYYRPFFYNPYSYGYGYGYGGYGYGYPGSYYRNAYLGEIRTEVKPQEATVFVDGDYAGKADDFDGWWQRLEVLPGRHRLTFRAPGFAPYVVDVRVAPGLDVHIEHELQPGQDQIAEQEMRPPRESEDYSRRNEGRPRYPQRDPYRRSEPREYDERDRQYNRDQDQRQDPYKQDPNKGDRSSRSESDRIALLLLVEPRDASVYIDGNYYGTANDNGKGEIQVLLPEGVHRVEVVRPGFTSASVDVNASRNAENRVTITLLKK